MRQLDFKSATLSRENLITAFSRIWAELGSLGMACGSGDFLLLNTGHLGVDLNTAIDKADAAIATLAIILGKSSSGGRAYDLRTGTHDVARLHSELDRLHARIAALGTASIPNDMIEKGPLALHRTGSASYVTTAGAYATAGDGVARFGIPGPVVRRNLFDNSVFSGGTTGWSTSNAATLTAIPLASLPSGHGETYGAGGRLTWTATAAQALQTRTLKVGQTITENMLVYIPSGFVGTPTLAILSSAWATKASAIISERDQWVLKSLTYTADTDDTVKITVGGGSGQVGQIIYFLRPQYEFASSATTYQPTNTTGVDLTAPINGAGLVLEGAGSNLVPNTNGRPNSLSANGTTPPTITGGAPLSDATNPFGSQAWEVTFAVGSDTGFAGCRVTSDSWAFSANVPYSQTLWIKTVQGSIDALRIRHTGTYGMGNLAKTGASINGWEEWVSLNNSSASPGNNYLAITLESSIAQNVIIRIAASQTEQSPFRTSMMLAATAPATRNADICALSIPCNELAYSHDLTKSVWSLGGFGTPTKSGDANTLVFSSGVDSVLQAITAHDPTKQSRCVTVKLKQGDATSGLLRFQLRDSGGASRGEVVIDLSKLSPTEWTTIPVSGTHANLAASTYALCLFDGATPATAGKTVLVKCFGANDGLMPSPEVMTFDTPILPSGVVVDPTWWTSGKIKASFVLPVGANTSAGTWIIGDNDHLAIKQYTTGITLYRLSNGNLRSVSVAVNAADGAKHTLEASWKSDMTLSLTVDGVTNSINAKTLYGDANWQANERLWLSQGSTYATLSDLKPLSN